MSAGPNRQGAWQLLRPVLLLWLCCGLVACGFALRGAVTLPPVLERVHLTHAQGGSLLLLDLADALQQAGSEIEMEPRPGVAVLEIQDEKRQRRVVAVSPEGRAQEYQLQLRIRYRLLRDDEEMLAPQSLELTRELSAGGGERVLGRESEADALEEEMRTDAVRLILRRLERVSLGNTPETEA